MMTKIINSAENCLEFDNDDAPNDSSLLLLATALKKSVSSVKDLSLNFCNKLLIKNMEILR